MGDKKYHRMFSIFIMLLVLMSINTLNADAIPDTLHSELVCKQRQFKVDRHTSDDTIQQTWYAPYNEYIYMINLDTRTANRDEYIYKYLRAIPSNTYIFESRAAEDNEVVILPPPGTTAIEFRIHNSDYRSDTVYQLTP